MLTYEINPSSRIAETRVATNAPDVFLSIKTFHRPGSFVTYLDRILIANGLVTMKMDAARIQDLAPISANSIIARRYSKKKLSEIHEDFLNEIDTETLNNSISWAERY